ncbi:hypothetical protein [Carnobacterium divergens]|uniref:hypothetical protein n=1 Tax=Carnobacterium divergens TaxID=2748 RepID=UPI000E1870A1|nr:hypothetical protein [Carnobacterium divergens]MDO0874485.1 hypothetical protein [Carnobacterium divergens]SUX22108.1 Uncharacterised protein [Carnobacterium divergens]
MIDLKPVTKDTIDEILALKVNEAQQSFVATSSTSLAYTYVYRDVTKPYGIYKDERLIGYVSIYRRYG